MELLKFVRLIVVLVPMVLGELMTSEENRALMLKNLHLIENNPKHSGMCDRLSKEPYFGVEMLLGNPWRVYYSWVMDLQNQCLDLRFMNATLAIITRTYNDMSEYLKTEPNWDAATLLVQIGRDRHELLLFADQGPAGRFQAVPNIIRDGSIPPLKRTVELLSFHFKLVNGGKYLLMADCNLGVTTLSSRKNRFPIRSEFVSIVSKLDIGFGYHTCQSNNNKYKNVPKE